MGLLTFDPRRLVRGLLGIQSMEGRAGHDGVAEDESRPGSFMLGRSAAPMTLNVAGRPQVAPHHSTPWTATSQAREVVPAPTLARQANDVIRVSGLLPFARLPQRTKLPSHERPTAPTPKTTRTETTKAPDPYSSENIELGPNIVYRDFLAEAARRTGRSPLITAGIVNAEAYPDGEGLWDPKSVNGRSSARGLTQFTTGTWIGETERRGTLLNETARKLGYLDAKGHVLPQHRKELLGLRFDPRLSIIAAAEYADDNLKTLEADHFVPQTPEETAIYAYLAHHHGAGGAKAHLRGDLEIDEDTFNDNVPADQRARYLKENHNDRGRAYIAYYNDYARKKVDITKFMKRPPAKRKEHNRP